MNLFIVSTLSCFLHYIVPALIKSILSRVFAQKKYDRELWYELKNLKEEMAGISMANEFAKYAKLQRRCNKLESTLQNNTSQLNIWKLKLQWSLIIIFNVLNTMLMIILFYMYKAVPVIVLPEGILWPVQNFLSWPGEDKNAISLFMWTVIARLGISGCRKLHE